MSTAIKKTTLRAQDLSCPSCVAKIEKALESMNGVERVEVHFATGRIAVEHDPQQAPTDLLVKAVADAGYVARASAF
ncbi:MAG TPA: heavy-metal-associated domain-containing protein [Thermomicrobiales bacterium]|nr:heavy-metal-associated domain-containing protein [Thermomicrobiales bacterium]